MRRREFIKVVGTAAVTWPFVARAQEPGRTYRVGLLLPFPRDAPFNTALFDELRRDGFIEGKNLTVDYRAFGQHVDLNGWTSSLPRLVASDPQRTCGLQRVE